MNIKELREKLERIEANGPEREVIVHNAPGEPTVFSVIETEEKVYLKL